MRQLMWALLLLPIIWQGARAIPPEMRFEEGKLVIIITDFSRLSTTDMQGYLTIDLGEFKKLHVRKDRIEVVREEPNDLWAYISFPTEIEVVSGKKVRAIIIRFPYSVDKINAKKLLQY